MGVSGSGPWTPALFVGRHRELERFRVEMDRVRLAIVYGVGGMGKTAFMARASEELAERLGARRTYHVCRSGESMASVARAALGQLGVAGDVLDVHGDPVEALAREVHRAALVLCLDDGHQIDDAGLLEGLAHLAARRLPLWVCLGSREVLAFSPTEVDHLVLRLGALETADAQALWATLERLYGPAATSFDEVKQRGTTTPLLLKQAFANPLAATNSDPLGLRDLPAFEAELLAEVCAYRRAVPLAALQAGRDPASVAEAVRRLTRRFVVELSTAGAIEAHDVVRDAVAASARPPTAQGHARCLAYYRALAAPRSSEDGPDVEILHHAAACGDDEVALGILLEHAAHARRMFPVGAVAERDLARVIDALGRRRPLPTAVRLLRAGIRARQGEPARAFAEIQALALSDEPLAELELGEMAFSLARAEEAVAHLARAAADERLGLVARLWASMVRIDAQRTLGRIGAAKRGLREAGPLFAAAGPAGEAGRWWLRAMMAYDCEDYRAARRDLAAAHRCLERATPAPLRIPLLASLESVVAAAAGEPRSEEVESGELFDETLFFRLAARLYHADALYYRGLVRDAAALAGATMQAAEAAGYAGHVWWALCFSGDAQRVLGRLSEVAGRLALAVRAAEEMGLRRDRARLLVVSARVLLAQGRTTEARALARHAGRGLRGAPGTAARLRATAARAAAAEGRVRTAVALLGSPSGAQGYELAEWRLARAEVFLWAGQLEPARRGLREIEASAEPAGWRWIGCRARLLAAEALYRQGDFVAAADGVAVARRDAEEAGYAQEALFGGLLGAGLARARGDRSDADHGLAAVAVRGGDLGFNIEAEAGRMARTVLAGKAQPADSPGGRLMRRLSLDEPVTVALREEGAEYFISVGQLAELELRRYALVVDLARGCVSVRGRRIDLTRRRVLVDLAGALAAPPGAVVSLAAIVGRAWGVDYHPLRHESRLRVAVARLRRVLGDQAVEAVSEGYRLVAPAPWAVARPLESRS